MHKESTMRLWPEEWLTDHGAEGEAYLSREANTMELLTLKAGWGRNRRFEIKDGHVRIDRGGLEPETSLTIKDGQIVEVQDIEHPAQNRSARIVTTKAWNESKRMRTDAIRTIQRYDTYSNLPSEGVFYEVTGLRIGIHKGTLRQIAKRARFVREEFVYDNGQRAYAWTPYRKGFRVYRPNGKLWIEVTAKVRRPWKRAQNLLQKVQATLDSIAGDEYRWSDKPNYEIGLYDERGSQYGYGKIENHQRVGVWRQGNARHYFMMGIAVSKELYYAGPDDLDPREVLKTENMQLRAALMKKIGPERLLKKLPFVACDADGDNQLLKADVSKIFTPNDQFMEQLRVRNRLDEQIAIALLKCPSTGQLYYLRVPPRLNKVEHARQWLCGVDIEGIEEEYIRQRWMMMADGRRQELSPSQQHVMGAEIARAKQHEKLEFVAEA